MVMVIEDVSLQMLELQKKYHETRMERDKELYERQIKGLLTHRLTDWFMRYMG
jgi:hypothetical protein